ncbi:MAG: hypothetical protein ACKO7D_11470 [Bacteroidota bacterium]
MKSILFIGNANSFLIIQLAKNLIVSNPDLQIDILSDQTTKSEDSPFHHSYCVDDSNPKASKKNKGFLRGIRNEKMN